jgi:hypothetical protein
MCAQEGYVTAATVVDHTIAHKGNEAIFWDQSTWQSLCKPCHDRHAQSRDRTGFEKPLIGLDGWPKEAELHLGSLSHPKWLRPLTIPLTIVCGPPASGKSTYVRQHKGKHDVVLDLDTIAVSMFGKAAALLTTNQRNQCLVDRNETLRDLMMAEKSSSYPRAWLIVSEPDARKRQWWADTLKPAQIIVIETHELTCVARAKADKDQQRPANVAQSIRDWWAAYTRRPGEHVIAA